MKFNEFVALSNLINEHNISLTDYVNNPNVLNELKSKVKIDANGHPIFSNPGKEAISTANTKANLDPTAIHNAGERVASNATNKVANASGKVNSTPQPDVKGAQDAAFGTGVDPTTTGEIAGGSATAATTASGTATSGTAVKGAMFAGISTNTLLIGAGAIGLAAILAWLFRRNIVNVIFMVKLKNNAKKTGDQIDEILLGKAKVPSKLASLFSKKNKEGKTTQNNLNIMITRKDELIKAKGKYEAELKKTKDSNTKERLTALMTNIDKELTNWDNKFTKLIDETVQTVITGKTNEIAAKIDENDTLNSARKIALKNVWDIMMINLKAYGWNNIAKQSIVSGGEVLTDIQNKIKEEGKVATIEFNKQKREFAKEFKGDGTVKLYDEKGENEIVRNYNKYYLLVETKDNPAVKGAVIPTKNSKFVKLALNLKDMIDEQSKKSATDKNKAKPKYQLDTYKVPIDKNTNKPSIDPKKPGEYLYKKDSGVITDQNKIYDILKNRVEEVKKPIDASTNTTTTNP